MTMRALTIMLLCHIRVAKMQMNHTLSFIGLLTLCSPHKAPTQQICHKAETQHNADCSFMLSSCKESITLLKELHSLQQSIRSSDSLHRSSFLSHSRVPRPNQEWLVQGQLGNDGMVAAS